MQGYDWTNLLLAAFISGLFMEVWAAFTTRIKGSRGEDAWMLEMGWMIGMAMIGTVLFLGIATQWVIGLDPLQWLLSAVFGGIGWFLGDLARQSILYRRTGIETRL